MAGKQRIKGREDGNFFAVIGDEDTVTGMLLAGCGHLDAKRQANFLVVDAKTTRTQIEDAFRTFTTRDDIAILLINQSVANDIRFMLDDYDKVVPTILEIPQKDLPFDPSKDSMMARVRRMTGQDQ